MNEQHPPDECHVIDPRLIPEIRKNCGDQVDMPVCTVRADAAIPFEPSAEPFETLRQRLVRRSGFQRFDPADRSEMPQESADFPLARGPGRPRPVAVVDPGNRIEELNSLKPLENIWGDIAQANPGKMKPGN